MSALPRNAAPLQSEPFDVIVVGGGVLGASIALEAARRGVRPLLLEKGDFGAETSFSTLRVLHGGFRYLQTLDLFRFRESVAARRWWIRKFPDLTAPLPCLLPLHGRGSHRPGVLRAALALNDVLSWQKTQGVTASSRLPRSRILDRSETLRAFPTAEPRSLQGGALWYDGDMRSPARLILEMLRWVCELGGASINYVEARGLETHRGRIRAVRAWDHREGTEMEFEAPMVINAAGPWSGALARKWVASGAQRFFHPSLAYNVLLDSPPPSRMAVAVRPPQGRSPVYFLRPVGDFTLAGTVHEPWPEEVPPPPAIPKASVERFLEDLAAAVPRLPIRESSVLRVLGGLVPARHRGSNVAAHRPKVSGSGESEGLQGLLNVSGVKFTTAPSLARKCVTLALRRHPAVSRWPVDGPRPNPRTWMSPNEFSDWEQRSPEEATRHIAAMVTEEGVRSLDDLIVRRLDWALHLRHLASGIEALGSASSVVKSLPENAPAE